MDFGCDNWGLAWHWLWLVPVLGAAAVYARWARRRALGAFAPDARLRAQLTASLDPRRRRWRLVILVLALAALGVALLQPYWGRERVARPVRGRDVLVVLDVSRSMLAADVAPTRLAHAKAALRELAAALPDDRFGLIAFAGMAFVQCPLTANRGGFLLTLDDADTATIPIGGTNLQRALALALEAFAASEGPHRAVVLVSDGEELQGQAAKLLARLRASGIPVHTVGVGDAAVGSLIQLPDKSFVIENGAPVRSRLNEAALRQIAAASGGSYMHSTPAASGMAALARDLRALTPVAQGEQVAERPLPRFQWPLALAVLLLLARALTGERRPVAGAPAAAALTLLLLVPGQLRAAPAAAGPPPPAAPDAALVALEADLAAAATPAAVARVQYNRGRRLQALERLTEAETAYDAALASGADGWLRGSAYENLGVIVHQQALAQLKPEPAAAVARLTSAIAHYRAALRLKPEDAELARNLELALRHRRAAEALVPVKQQYDEQLAQAREQTAAALAAQRQANADRQPAAPATTAATAAAAAAVARLRPLAQQLDLDAKPGQAAVLLAAAGERQRLVPTAAEPIRARLGDDAGTCLARALVLLGGTPEASPPPEPPAGQHPPPPEPPPDAQAMAKLLTALAEEEKNLREQVKREELKQQPESQGGRNW